MLLALLMQLATAADWVSIQGSEVGREDKPLVPFGFVQPQFDAHVGGEALDGARPIFNTVNGGGPTGVQVRRARLALRGSVPHTNQRVSYFVMTESGEVSLTRSAPVVFSDMSVSLAAAPGLKFRVGQFKLPAMEEVQQGVAASLEFIHFSNTLTGLMLENPISAEGAYTAGAFGFRDVGLQVFDGFQQGKVAGAYAVMVSNGNGLHAADTDAQKDVTVRGELAWVTGGQQQSGRRQEVKLGGWWLEGTRPNAAGPSADDRVRRMRRGAFLHVEQGRYWSLIEVAQGVGALEAGRAPPFPSGIAVVVPDGEAWGVVAQGGVRFDIGDTSLGVKGRYDQFNRRTEDPVALRVFRTGTAGIEFDPVKPVRLQANYELRRMAAPDGDDAAQTVAAAMGDRVMGQVTVSF